MPDFLVHSPDLPTLQAVVQQIPGLWVPESADDQGNTIPAHILGQGEGPDGGGWAWAYIGTWAGHDGVYGVLRINYDPAQMPLPSGATTTADPSTGAITVTAGPVTMSSPLPDDVPLRFA